MLGGLVMTGNKIEHLSNPLLLRRLSELLQSGAWPRYILEQVLSSQSIVSSYKTAGPCSPCGGQAHDA